jgi:hypothetical protein
VSEQIELRNRLGTYYGQSSIARNVNTVISEVQPSSWFIGGLQAQDLRRDRGCLCLEPTVEAVMVVELCRTGTVVPARDDGGDQISGACSFVALLACRNDDLIGAV